MASLGEKRLGSTVKIKVNGYAENFLVVQQGRPSGIYDISCDGTWLLMEEIYTSATFSRSGNNYGTSSAHSLLNNSFLNALDASIRPHVKSVRIPYQSGTGSEGKLMTGSNGLSCKAFLLSAYEVGVTSATSNYAPLDGARLAYFDRADDSVRIARINGNAVDWVLRSPNTYNSSDMWYIKSNGAASNMWYFSNNVALRPCIILPSNITLTDDGDVESNNFAPTTPASIAVPSNVMGGANITVSWEKSTDADGNLAGYKLERSTDGGSLWTQVYQGPANSLTIKAPLSSSVIFRVKAYDDGGLESSWKTSSQVTIINNVAPTNPSSITVPTDISAGGAVEIVWAASTDADGNLAGYILERSVDGGNSWAQIYKGTRSAYTDTAVKGWTSVRYRVKAYDDYEAQSEYTVSEVRSVNNNTAPTITCNASADLGTKVDGFSVTYTISDVDEGDNLSVTEKIDGVTKRTFTPTRGADNAFSVTGESWQKLSNGTHTLTISATDGKVTALKEFTFIKQITTATVTLSTPMLAAEPIRVLRLNISGDIPADADFQVLATNNANDVSPVWEDATQAVRGHRNHVFENSTQTAGWALNFKLSAKRGASGIGGIITKVEGAFGASASGNSGGGIIHGLSVVDGAFCITYEE